jgi:hypothetical protein
MKVTITLDDGSEFIGEGFSLEMAFNAVASEAGFLEEGEEVRILCEESLQILD